MNLPGLPCNESFWTCAQRNGFSLIYGNIKLESQGSPYYFTKTTGHQLQTRNHWHLGTVCWCKPHSHKPGPWLTLDDWQLTGLSGSYLERWFSRNYASAGRERDPALWGWLFYWDGLQRVKLWLTLLLAHCLQNLFTFQAVENMNHSECQDDNKLLGSIIVQMCPSSVATDFSDNSTYMFLYI